MHESTRPTTVRERDRALERLRSITAGTAVMATMATAGFGTLAAFTWSGTQTGNPDAATDDATTLNATTAQVDPDNDGDVDVTTQSGTSGTTGAAATASPIQAAPTPTPTRRKARVTSGGSG